MIWARASSPRWATSESPTDDRPAGERRTPQACSLRDHVDMVEIAVEPVDGDTVHGEPSATVDPRSPATARGQGHRLVGGVVGDPLQCSDIEVAGGRYRNPSPNRAVRASRPRTSASHRRPGTSTMRPARTVIRSSIPIPRAYARYRTQTGDDLRGPYRSHGLSRRAVVRWKSLTLR